MNDLRGALKYMQLQQLRMRTKTEKKISGFKRIYSDYAMKPQLRN